MNPRRAISSVTTKIHVQRVRMRTRTYVDRVPSNVATDSVLAPYGALTVSRAYVIVSPTCTLTIGLFPRFNRDLKLPESMDFVSAVHRFCVLATCMKVNNHRRILFLHPKQMSRIIHNAKTITSLTVQIFVRSNCSPSR